MDLPNISGIVIGALVGAIGTLVIRFFTVRIESASDRKKIIWEKRLGKIMALEEAMGYLVEIIERYSQSYPDVDDRVIYEQYQKVRHLSGSSKRYKKIDAAVLKFINAVDNFFNKRHIPVFEKEGDSLKPSANAVEALSLRADVDTSFYEAVKIFDEELIKIKN